MEYRQLCGSGLRISALGFGTTTFGGVGDAFKAWGSTDGSEAQRMVHLCLEYGVNYFDTANVYSAGRSEEILGLAVAEHRQEVIISTKGAYPMSNLPTDSGLSRYALIRACEASLRRLGTDYIDIYYVHGFDTKTPVEETLRALDDLTQSGKVRYIGCSNFSGWHLMKSLAISERYGWSRYMAHQVYYSLVSREFEWELMPLAADQRVGTVVWSPLAGGALTGKMSRRRTAPPDSRLAQGDFLANARSERLFDVIDALEEVALLSRRSVAQVALRWVLQRPTVASVIVGARSESQLKENLGATGWSLDGALMRRLEEQSTVRPVYPYWHQHLHPVC